MMGLILAVFNSHFMSQADVGIYGIVISLSLLFGILSDAGLSTAVLRTYYDHHRNPEAARQYVSRLVTGARLVAWIALAVLSGIGALLWDILSSGEIPLWPYLPITIAITIFMRHAQVLGAICRVMDKKAIYFAGQMTMVTVAILGSLVLVVEMKGGVTGALGAFLIAQAASAFLFSAMLMWRLDIRPARPQLAELGTAIQYGLPLAFTQLAAWGRNIALRVILVHLVSLAQVGVFFISSQLALGFSMLTQAIEFAFVPRYFKLRVRGEDKAKEQSRLLARLTLAALVPVYALTALFSRELFAILLPGNYAEGAEVLAILLVASFLQIQTPTLVRQFNFLKRTAMVPAFTTLPVILALAAVPLAVHLHGLPGAAWTVAAGNAVSLLLGNILISRYEASDHPWGVSLSTTGLLALAALAVQTKAILIESEGLSPTAYLFCRLAILAIVLLAAAYIVWPHRENLRRMLRN